MDFCLLAGEEAVSALKAPSFFINSEAKTPSAESVLACSVAGGQSVGLDFCKALAKATDCTVIAGDIAQSVEKMFDFFRPDEYIDDFEGTATVFRADGFIYAWRNTFGKEY